MQETSYASNGVNKEETSCDNEGVKKEKKETGYDIADEIWDEAIAWEGSFVFQNWSNVHAVDAALLAWVWMQ